MKEIKLTQGKVALVDDGDFNYLNQFTWYVHKQRTGSHYAYNNIKRKNIAISMHRLIMDTPPSMDVDHIDGNGLNNQKNNLRNCTRSQNNANRKPIGKYKGVSYPGKYIRAKINIDRKSIHIGYYKTDKLAALAYDKKARELYGEFAYLNFPDPETNFEIQYK